MKMQYWILKLPANHPQLFREPEGDIIYLDEYVAVWKDFIEVNPDEPVDCVLDDLFMQFNIKHPENYAASSLSVGDVIVLRDLTAGTADYYVCASASWKAVFHTPSRN